MQQACLRQIVADAMNNDSVQIRGRIAGIISEYAEDSDIVENWVLKIDSSSMWTCTMLNLYSEKMESTQFGTTLLAGPRLHCVLSGLDEQGEQVTECQRDGLPSKWALHVQYPSGVTNTNWKNDVGDVVCEHNEESLIIVPVAPAVASTLLSIFKTNNYKDGMTSNDFVSMTFSALRQSTPSLRNIQFESCYRSHHMQPWFPAQMISDTPSRLQFVHAMLWIGHENWYLSKIAAIYVIANIQQLQSLYTTTHHILYTKPINIHCGNPHCSSIKLARSSDWVDCVCGQAKYCSTACQRLMQSQHAATCAFITMVYVSDGDNLENKPYWRVPVREQIEQLSELRRQSKQPTKSRLQILKEIVDKLI